LSTTIHPSDSRSILPRTFSSFSGLSNLSSSSPRDSILLMAVTGSTSTSILTSGVGRTLANILYAIPARSSGRYATAMMYLTNTTSSNPRARFILQTDLTTSAT